MKSILTLGKFIVVISPSLMILIYVDFVKSNHYGFYPEVLDMKWYEIVLFFVVAFWQFAAVYAIISIKDE